MSCLAQIVFGTYQLPTVGVIMKTACNGLRLPARREFCPPEGLQSSATDNLPWTCMAAQQYSIVWGCSPIAPPGDWKLVEAE